VLCHYTGKPFDLDRETNVTIDTTYQRYRVVVSSYGVERPKTIRYEAFCPLPHAVTGRPMPVSIYLYLPKDSLQPVLGDTLIISARLRVPEPQGSFDYARYLRTRGIVASAFTRRYDNHSPITIRTLSDHSPFTMIQHRLVERYRELGVHGSELGTIAALTLGYRESLEPDIRQAFQTAGAMHVLAVSGLHTGILMSVLWWLLTGLGLYPPLWEERGRRISLAISMIILLWCYAGITGWTPSVVRSVVMCSIAMLGYMCHRTPLSINTVAAAAFLILLFRPNDLFSISFQLSFAAVFGILLLMPLFRFSFGKNKVLRYLRDCVTVSLSAQLATTPLTLYYFGTFSTYFLLTNIVILPMAFVLMVLALLTLTIGWIPAVGPFLGQWLQWTTYALNHYVMWIESLPGASIVL